MLKFGTTTKDLTASFGWRDEFKVPAGTQVEFGAPNCDGNPFRSWTLPSSTAAELSGNTHDAKYRFITIPSEYVRAVVQGAS